MSISDADARVTAAREDGRRAAGDGYRLRDNPYDRRRPEWAAWKEGFADCRAPEAGDGWWTCGTCGMMWSEVVNECSGIFDLATHDGEEYVDRRHQPVRRGAI